MGSAREPAQAARILPGTPMRKVVPPRMVGPYMSGQRGVIAGYVHRVRDVVFRNPADAFYALGLGYEGSDFKPDMPELYFLCWQAREIDGYVPVSARGMPGRVEFYLEPIQIPVGTTLCRLAGRGRGTSRPLRRTGLAAAEGGVRLMRYRLMASYLGASYQAAVGPSDRDVTLFAAPPPPEEHGFSPAPGGIWRKQVRLDELDALWESRPIGSYHGEPCLVLDDLGDRLHIVYLGMDERRAAQLGYWEVDRGRLRGGRARHDVTDLAEERHEFPIALLLARCPPGRGRSAPAAPTPGGARVRPERRRASHGRERGAGGGGPAIGAIGPGSAAGAGQAMGMPGPGGMPGWNGQAGPQQPGPRQLPPAMPQQPAAAALQQPVTGAYQSPLAPNGLSGQNGMSAQSGVNPQNGMTGRTA